jgi:hypothetical protein
MVKHSEARGKSHKGIGTYIIRQTDRRDMYIYQSLEASKPAETMLPVRLANLHVQGLGSVSCMTIFPLKHQIPGHRRPSRSHQRPNSHQLAIGSIALILINPLLLILIPNRCNPIPTGSKDARHQTSKHLLSQPVLSLSLRKWIATEMAPPWLPNPGQTNLKMRNGG